MRALAIVIVIFLLISVSSKGQTLHACYQNGGELYCFWNNNEFDWVQKTGPTTAYGSGTYNINGKNIQINFTRTPRRFEVQLNESKPNNSELATIEVRAIQSNGIPFEGLDIILRQSNVETKTDKLGIAHLNLGNPPADDKLELGFDGFVSSGIPLKLKGNDHIFAVVVDETNKYRENESITLTFKHNGRKIKLNGKAFKRIPHTNNLSGMIIGG